MKLGVLLHLLKTPHFNYLKIVGGYALNYLKSMAMPRLCMGTVSWVPIPTVGNPCLSHEN